jgi:hypothetical protein
MAERLWEVEEQGRHCAVSMNPPQADHRHADEKGLREGLAQSAFTAAAPRLWARARVRPTSRAGQVNPKRRAA